MLLAAVVGAAELATTSLPAAGVVTAWLAVSDDAALLDELEDAASDEAAATVLAEACICIVLAEACVCIVLAGDPMEPN
jgi:hypothetical protein